MKIMYLDYVELRILWRNVESWYDGVEKKYECVLMVVLDVDKFIRCNSKYPDCRGIDFNVGV